MTDRDVAVVLPVRDAAEHVGPCLDALEPEARAHDAEVIVVDDASTDGSAAVAGGRGVRVLALDHARGPYGAREAGWRSSDATVVVLLDVRCRVRPGWLDALLAPLDRLDVAISGAGYALTPGRSVASRAAATQDGFRPEASLEGPSLPFLPAGNLAVRRAALEAIGGLPTDLASGGDLALCWAVQLAGLGDVVHAPGAEVDWVPRDRVVEYVRQRAKYGAARVPVELRFAGRVPPPVPPATFPLLVHAGRWLRRLATRDVDPRVQAVVAAADYAHARAYRTAYLRAARRGDVPPPGSRWAAARSRLSR